MTNPQDIPDRRVYLIRAKNNLINKLKCLEAGEVIADVSEPFIIMTDELPFEEYLQGYRRTILELSKLEFIKSFILECPYIPEDLWSEVDRINEVSVEAFDLYWEAIEANSVTLPTNIWR